MDALETIMTRRSIRRYTDEAVDDETVERLLRAGMAAPSAGNQQPWRFVVVRDASTKRALSEASPYAAMLPSAPVAIVVCADPSVEKHTGYWVQDCSAAAQNILLAARALGLGAVWLGFYPVRERVAGAAAALRLPDGIVPMCIIPVGHPKEDPAMPDRFSAEHVHHDRW